MMENCGAALLRLNQKPREKKKIVDALNACQDDPYVNLSVAKLFWKERKNEKARKWIEKAILLNKNIADSWAALYFFLLNIANDKNEAQNIYNTIIRDKPKIGRLWNQVKKSEEAFLDPASKNPEWIL